MQNNQPDLLISLLPMLTIYGIASFFALRKRRGEITRTEGFRRWRWMHLYILIAIALATVTVWLRNANSN